MARYREMTKVNGRRNSHDADRVRRGRGRAYGFTMIEMLAVMALMIVLMGIGVVGFLDFKKDAAIRSSTLGVKTGVAQARQVAITYRTSAYLRYGNTDSSIPGVKNGFYVVSTNEVRGDVSQTNWLAEGIVFGDPSSPSAKIKDFEEKIRFRYDGSCGGVGQYEILIVDRERQNAETPEGNAMTNMLVVKKLTGLCRIVEPGYKD